MSSLEHASTAQTNLQNVDLFNFPAPPSQSPEESPHLDKDGSINQKQDEHAAVDKFSLKAEEGLCINTGETAKTDALPVLHIETAGLNTARFNRISKSTISLPFFPEHSADEIDSALDDNDVFGKYKSPKGAKMFSHARGAKSHHHLPCVSDNAPLSQSLVSLANKGEQMSEVADLLSPIESGSYESDMEQSLEAITLVSQIHENAVLRPKTSHHQQEPQSRHNVSATSHYNDDVPATQIRKQISMAQIESRYNNRNSMVVSDMLFPSTCEFAGDGFDAENPHLRLQPQAHQYRPQTRNNRQSCYQLDSSGNTHFESNTASSQKGSTTGGLSGARTQILRSVKSAGAHLSMLRPWKSRETPNRIRAEWELSSASSESTYSDGDYCSSFSGASQQEDMKPRHKHSTIQLIVKRAGLGLLRRSTSFYKSFSGASLSENSSAKGTGAVVSSFSKFSSISSGSSEYARKNKPKIGHRFATVVRQAGNRLKDTLRSHDKEDSHLQEDSEVVSAYPADSATGKELDTYLSMSAIHSPVPSAPVNSRANSGSDENIAQEQECIIPSGYVPPKRPPYLGLHRSSIVEGDYESVKEDNCIAIEDTSALPQIVPTTRLRATQFNSPFTTLPYGAYAQLQLKSHHYHS
ncbi:hypothetical protein H4S08_001248 [Coemansia sp. RSA 1365]|nr:hypothetical protein H4S08_001248 [Coemansia sp. RSA 1365]